MEISSNPSMEPVKKRKLEDNGVVSPPESTSTLSSEDIRKIIEPFTHEQLLQIVQTAALRHLDVLVAVRAIADRDPTQRKLFVRGLGWETTSDSLRTVFAAYGDLEEAVVILDKATGKSKGYGFVTYRHLDGALMALKEPSKKIDGRMIVAQIASAGLTGSFSVTPVSQTLDLSSRKIYVGNVPFDMPAEKLLAYFLSYGEVEEGPIGFDKATGKSKGFALFVYKNVEGVRASLVDPIKTIDGHKLHCRLANDAKKGKPSGVTGMQPPNVVPPVVASSTAQLVGGVRLEANMDWQGLQPPPVVQQVVASSAAQLSGGVMPEANEDRQRLDLNQQGSMQGSFASQFGGRDPLGMPGPGGNTGGLGLPGQGPSPLGYSKYSQNLNSGSEPGLSSFGGGGGPGLWPIGNQASSSFGGFTSSLGNGGSHFGRPGSNYGGLDRAGGAGLGGAGTRFGGSGSAGGAGLGGAGTGSGGSGNAGGAVLDGAGTGFGGLGGVRGEMFGGTGTVFGGSGRGSSYGLPPGSARMSSGGYPESAHYSLSSGSGYESQHHQATGTPSATRVTSRGSYQGRPYH